MERISSLNNNHIKYLASLKEKKYREINKEFVVEGYHLVNEAYKKGILKEVISSEITDFDVCNVIVSEEIIKKLSDTFTPQNILGLCKMEDNDIDYHNLKRIIILDDVKDPGNMGAIFRSALGFNIDMILLSEECVDVYNSKVLRSSQGAILNVCFKYLDIKKAIVNLKENGFKVFHTTVVDSKKINDANFEGRVAIVFGNEAHGVRSDVASLCSDALYIPINPKLESLNVSVACAIVMYELNKSLQ